MNQNKRFILGRGRVIAISEARPREERPYTPSNNRQGDGEHANRDGNNHGGK